MASFDIHLGIALPGMMGMALGHFRRTPYRVVVWTANQWARIVWHAVCRTFYEFWTVSSRIGNFNGKTIAFGHLVNFETIQVGKPKLSRGHEFESESLTPTTEKISMAPAQG